MAYFIDTDPPEVNWVELYDANDYHIRVRVRETADRTAKPGTWVYNLDLTKFYSYCNITDIDLLGHTIDVVHGNDVCVLSFYFASIADKAHFILKFK